MPDPFAARGYARPEVLVSSEWLAEHLGQGTDEVKGRCNEAFSQLPSAIEHEFSADEVRERTDGVWTIRMLKEPL